MSLQGFSLIAYNIMKVFVGTSGWYYDWNKDKTLDWYIDNSGLNAVELNASFYRFPFPSQIKSWAKKGRGLRWSIKVNQLITHRLKFSDKARVTWQKFMGLFSIMNDLIDFYLFQLPPSMSSNSKEKISDFLQGTKVLSKCALECRHDSWFTNDLIVWAKSLGLTWVSIDAPKFSRDIIKTTESVYLRMHGRKAWYNHDYKTSELKAIGKHIRAAGPENLYVFFNNDHNMLKNAQRASEIFGHLKA